MLSKPKLESSGGSSAATSPTSSASRSRIALAYSARFSRCGARRPGFGMRGGGAIECRFERSGKTVITRLVRSPHTGRRHRTGPKLSDDFFPNVAVLGNGR